MASSNAVSYELLRRLWYKKLAKGGFVDIERNDGQLKDYQQQRAYRKASRVVVEATQEYYSQASAFLETHTWTNIFDRQVWALHSEGFSVREIGRLLNRSATPIQRRIRRVRILAGFVR
jgi:hypothetical protein